MKKNNSGKRLRIGTTPPHLSIKTLEKSHADFLIDFRTRYERDLDTGCWIWKSANRGNTYGTIIHDGRQIRATRYAYEKFIGPVPDGAFMCHRCDNPRCVNPGHLFFADHLANIRDMVSKGRHSWGERNGRAKRTEAEIRRIRELLDAGMTNAEIGRIMGMARQRVSDIKLGKIWANLS